MGTFQRATVCPILQPRCCEPQAIVTCSTAKTQGHSTDAHAGHWQATPWPMHTTHRLDCLLPGLHWPTQTRGAGRTI
jgi:hypothetical protein